MRHNTRKGSNQHRTKFKGLQFKVWRDIVYIMICVSLVTYFGYKLQHKHVTLKIQSPVALANADQPVSDAQKNEQLIIVDSNTNPTQDEIEAYIKRIFVEDPTVAVAISRAECPPSNKLYPHCILHTDQEYSVGIFQINLYNKEQKIHADRIPGTTMDEKIEWLKNPFNCALYAHWVYTTSGWTPWSTYTNQAYLAHMDN